MSLDAQPIADQPSPLGPASGGGDGPSLPVAIVVAYLARLLLALLASYPAVAYVSASGILDFDSGDGKLFEPGGLYLLEVLVRERAALMALAAPTAWLLLLGSLALVVPEWLLLRALGARSSEPPQRSLARLGALALGSWVARALLAFATGGLAIAARGLFVSARDERAPLLAAGVVVLFGLVGWACIGALHDLAKIEVTRGAAPLEALERALATSRRHALQLAARYGAWTLATGAALVAGTAAAASFDVAAGGGPAALAAIVVHQSTVLAQIGLHAAWLASALAVRRQAPRRPGPGGAQADAFL